MSDAPPNKRRENGNDNGQPSFSRRDAMLMATGAAIAGGAVWKSGDAIDYLYYKNAGDKLEATLEKRYKVKFPALMRAINTVLRNASGVASDVKLVELNTYKTRLRVLESIDDVLKAYPPDIFERSNLKEFISAAELHYQGKRMPEAGVYSLDSKEYRRIVILVLRGGGARFAFTVDHEIGHALTLAEPRVSEEEWAVATHGSLEAYRRDIRSFRFTEDMRRLPHPGFAELYAQKNHHEDMAVVFMHMMRHPESVLGVHQNEIATKKIQFIKRRVEQISGGRMNDSYWRMLIENKKGNQNIISRYWKEDGGVQ
jgi:hypothetical protein